MAGSLRLSASVAKAKRRELTLTKAFAPKATARSKAGLTSSGLRMSSAITSMPKPRASNSLDLSGVIGVISIHHHCDLVEARNHAFEYLQSFTDQLRCIHRSASHIRARTLKTLNKPESDRIVDGKHHDWSASCRSGSGNGGRCVGREDDFHLVVHKFGHYAMIIRVKNAFAIFDSYALPSTYPRSVSPFLNAPSRSGSALLAAA